MEIDVGRIGATRQTWRGEKTARDLLRKVMSDDPSGKDRWRAAFKDSARDDPEYFDAICDYAFDNAIMAVYRKQLRTEPTADEKAASAQRRADELKTHATKVQSIKEKIILLAQVMPNGKPLHSCTMDYLWRLGGKYKMIGKQGSTKLVGDVYDEEGYRKKLVGLL